MAQTGPAPKPVVVMDERQIGRSDHHSWSYQEALEGAGFDVRVRRLAAGDLCWDCPIGRVGVEDKPLAALLGDRRNGRLDDELRRLTQTYELPILMVRGSPRVDRDGRLMLPGIPGEHYGDWDFNALDNLRLGRELHGVLLAECPTDSLVGWRVRSLYEYTQVIGPLEGVRREPHFTWLGPMTARAETVYGILGLVRGIRDRRGIAERIAGTTPVKDFVRWTNEDFRAAGFSKVMAGRLAEAVEGLNSTL